MILRLWILLALAAGCNASPEVADPSPEALGEAEAAPADTVRADWGAHFEAAGARGTFVLLDTETGQVSRFDPGRAAERFSPASTSKVFNALVFLDRGVVTDPDSMLAWDGVDRRMDAWNRDHSLRTGVEFSAVWLFQRLAREVGQSGYDEVFARQPYGNSTMGEPLDMAWLNGTLRISADEQVRFLDGLRRGTLGFSPEAQATTREILPELASGDGWVLKAKTGWGIPDGEPSIGWLVGWVEREEGDLVFAMNATEASAGSFDIGPGRLQIVRAVLGSEGFLPGD